MAQFSWAPPKNMDSVDSSTNSQSDAKTRWYLLNQQELDRLPSFLKTLKAQWTEKKLDIPDDWIDEPSVERTTLPAFSDEELSIPVVKSLCRIRDMINPLHFHEQQSRSIDTIGPEPDFLAALSPSSRQDFALGLSLKESAFMDNLLQFNRLRDLLYYPYQDLIRRRRTDTAGHVAMQIATCLLEFPGFFLRTHVANGFSTSSDDSEQVDFALLVRQHGSRPEGTFEREYSSLYHPPVWKQRREVGNNLRISDTHPAVIMGIVDPPYLAGSSNSSTESAQQRLARMIEPSLQAILKVWDMWRRQKNHSSELPCWLIVFGIVVSDEGVRIIAHYPNNHDETALDPDALRFCSCVLDDIPFHTDVRWDDRAVKWNGPVEDDKWIRHRLRLFIALLTIFKNSQRIAAIWDEIDWPRDLVDAEDALEKRHAQWDKPTPTPSYDSDSSDDEIDYRKIAYELLLAANSVEEGSEEEDTTERDEENAQRIKAWRRKVAAA